MRNRTLVEISFAAPRFLEDALDAVLSVIRFLVMLAGRPQTVDAVAVDTVGGPRQPLELYWTHVPIRPAQWEERSPHPAEVLIRVVDEPQQFATVLRNWLAVDLERRLARVRFAIGFEHQRSFSVDRLVGAANMYDILPDDAFGDTGPLADDVARAKAVARDAFRGLPPSPERASILSALGRLGRPTLRSKIGHRAGIVSRALATPLTDLGFIVDEAVRCRNHYVHGSSEGIDYIVHDDVMTFLTSVLEFLFAGSDLIDAGWDIAGWRARGSGLAHPFGRVLHMWDPQVARIRELRSAAAS